MKKFMLRITAWLLVFIMTGSIVGNAGITKVNAAEYPGDYSNGYTVQAGELAQFEGDVTLTVEYTLLDGFGYSQFAFVNLIDGWPALMEDDFVNLSYPTNNGWFNTLRSMSGNEITVTIKEDVIKEIVSGNRGLGLQVYGVVIDKVTLGGEASADPNAGYTGDWGLARKISLETLAEQTGDVQITVTYRQYVGGNYGWWQMSFSDLGNNWTALSASDYAKLDNEINDYNCLTVDPAAGTITVTISKKAIDRVIANGQGLGIQTYGIIVESVQVGEKPTATPTVKPTPTTKPSPTPTLKPGAPTPTPTPTNTPTPTPTPIVYQKADKMVLTSDMVASDGTVLVKYYEVETLYIPRDTGAKKITLDGVNAKKLLVESGATYELEISSGEIAEFIVVPAQVNGIEGELTTPITNPTADEYALYLKTLNEKPVITTGKGAEIASLVVKGNADLNLQKGDVNHVNVDATESYLLLFVDIDGYRGNVSVTNREEKKNNCTVFCDLGSSRVNNFAISGGGVCRISGNGAAIDTLEADGIAGMTISVDTRKAVVEGNTSDSKVKIYADVNNLRVAGEGNDIVLANSAVVDNAEVTGDNTRIYGYGRLKDAEVTGEGAVIATPNTDVEGEYDHKAPAEMENMKPNTPGSSSSDSGSTTPSTPTEKKVTVVLDAAYPGSYQSGTNIDADVFKQFDGDIAVTLNYVLTGTSSWPQFACILAWSEGWPKVNTSASGTSGFTATPEGTSQITFVIPAEEVDRIVAQGPLGFQVDGVYFTKATLRDAKKDDWYVGNWNAGYTFTAEEIADLYGDVTVTLDYTTVSEGFEYYQMQMTDISDWSNLGASDFNDLAYEMNDYKCITVNAGSGTMTFNIKSDSFAKIIANGNNFAIRVYGVVIDSATITGEERPAATPTPTPTPAPAVSTEIYLDTGYPGSYGGSNNIPAAVFSQFSGDITVTVEYVVADSTATTQFACIDSSWNKIPTSLATEFMQVDTTKDTLTFTIAKDDIPSGTMSFQVNGIYITKVTLSGDGTANEEAAYAGDWGLAHKFFASELAAYADKKVIITANYTKLSSATEYNFVVSELTGWSAVSSYYSPDSDAGTITVELTADKVNELISAGTAIGIQVKGLLIGEVTIEAEEAPAGPSTEVLISTGYPGGYNVGNWIPGGVFSQFTGDVTITVEYVVADSTANAQFACIDSSWAKVPTSLATEFMQVDTEANTLTFTIAAADVPSGNLGFQVNGIYITKATVSGEGTANADAAYAGDWQIAHKFNVSEFSAYADKSIDVTVTYKTLESADYTWYKASLSELSGYTDLISADVSASGNTVTLTLTADQVNTLISGDTALGVKVYGILVENAVISEAVTQ